MDQALFQRQNDSCIRYLAPVTGRWYWTPAGGSAVEIVGTAGSPMPDDPRLSGSTKRIVLLRCPALSFPSPAPQRGDFIVRDGVKYSLAENPDHLEHGIVVLVLNR